MMWLAFGLEIKLGEMYQPQLPALSPTFT